MKRSVLAASFLSTAVVVAGGVLFWKNLSKNPVTTTAVKNTGTAADNYVQNPPLNSLRISLGPLGDERRKYLYTTDTHTFMPVVKKGVLVYSVRRKESR